MFYIYLYKYNFYQVNTFDTSVHLISEDFYWSTWGVNFTFHLFKAKNWFSLQNQQTEPHYFDDWNHQTLSDTKLYCTACADRVLSPSCCPTKSWGQWHSRSRENLLGATDPPLNTSAFQTHAMDCKYTRGDARGSHQCHAISLVSPRISCGCFLLPSVDEHLLCGWKVLKTDSCSATEESDF